MHGRNEQSGGGVVSPAQIQPRTASPPSLMCVCVCKKGPAMSLSPVFSPEQSPPIFIHFISECISTLLLQCHCHTAADGTITDTRFEHMREKVWLKNKVLTLETMKCFYIYCDDKMGNVAINHLMFTNFTCI